MGWHVQKHFVNVKILSMGELLFLSGNGQPRTTELRSLFNQKVQNS